MHERSTTSTASWRVRARRFASEYGKVGVCTHMVLSLTSFVAIYSTMSAGVDVPGFVHNTLGIHWKGADSAGNFVVSYGIYKLLTPVRWATTFAVTPMVVRGLRRRGFRVGNVSDTGRSSPPPNNR